MLINRANLTAMFQGFKVLFNEAFTTAESQFEKVAMTVPSSTKQEIYAWLGSATRFREWLGDRVIQNLGTHDFTIKNRAFENTVGVDRNDIEDDTYGVYKPLIQQLGQDAKTHPDELVFGLLKDGFTEACYDGQPFFDLEHPVPQPDGSELLVPNMVDGAATPWFLLDVSRAIKPFIFQKRQDYRFVAMDQETDEVVFSRKLYRYGVDGRMNAGYGLWQFAFGSKAALDATSYGAARAAMRQQTGEHGKPLTINPGLLVVPPSLEKAALEITVAERTAAGATNVWRNTAQVLVSPWLGD